MTVSPTNWISNSLQAVQTLLVACPTYATLGLSASNTYWQSVRSGPLNAPYACIVVIDGDEDESTALKVVTRRNNVGVYLVWSSMDQAGDTNQDKTMRATNAFGLLLSEITDRIATSTYLVRATRRYELPTRTSDKDDQDEQANAWEAAITFSWEI